MKLLQRKSIGCRAIAMTEYLIILAVVAIAAIVIVGLFGQEIKVTFAKITGSMAGTSSSASDVNSSADQNASSANTMANFNKQ
jgi:FtsZ-interacting cell division protein ZipA